MEWFEALILGIIQGLTEYLPVSSSGHLAIGAHLFGLSGEENLTFTVAVHVATVLSTLVILWKEVVWIFNGLFKMKMNDETCPTEFIIYSTILYCVRRKYCGSMVGSIAWCGMLIMV